ncbi:hypothetical protein [Brevirhabdus sp.]|uniref:hypothetical protein n=1 Tax=Brevirhabdus sp. TaxID=2004514 RepID=UPI004057ED67
MAFGKDHELHERRFSRNLWVGLLLTGFVALVFGLTVVKVTREGEARPAPAAVAADSGASPVKGASQGAIQ